MRTDTNLFEKNTNIRLSSRRETVTIVSESVLALDWSVCQAKWIVEHLTQRNRLWVKKTRTKKPKNLAIYQIQAKFAKKKITNKILFSMFIKKVLFGVLQTEIQVNHIIIEVVLIQTGQLTQKKWVHDGCFVVFFCFSYLSRH